MGIKSLKAVPSAVSRPNLTLDLEPVIGVKGSSVSFREPKAADMFPSASEHTDFKMKFPEFSDTMIHQILIMAKTYVPDDEDTGVGEISPALEFVKQARANSDFFIWLIGEYTSAFPSSDFRKFQKEVPNDSTE
jgi:hypothetical protein